MINKSTGSSASPKTMHSAPTNGKTESLQEDSGSDVAETNDSSEHERSSSGNYRDPDSTRSQQTATCTNLIPLLRQKHEPSTAIRTLPWITAWFCFVAMGLAVFAGQAHPNIMAAAAIIEATPHSISPDAAIDAKIVRQAKPYLSKRSRKVESKAAQFLRIAKGKGLSRVRRSRSLSKNAHHVFPVPMPSFNDDSPPPTPDDETTEQPTVRPKFNNVGSRTSHPTGSWPTSMPTPQILPNGIINSSTSSNYNNNGNESPSLAPTTSAPMASLINTTPTSLSYIPGDLTVSMNGLILSTGLSCRILARSGAPVQIELGNQLISTFQHVAGRGGSHSSSSPIIFHDYPDAGATFVDPNQAGNPGGWIYVSNSEVSDFVGYGLGGVSGMIFNQYGRVIDYQNLVPSGTTTANCGGGVTPWNTWVSCEEYYYGYCWQVDPANKRPPQILTMTFNDQGYFESFAADIARSQFFVSEDAPWGPLRRFRPYPGGWDPSDPWSMLHVPGITDYLILDPATWTYRWTTNKAEAQDLVNTTYPSVEGLDVYEDRLYFVAKKIKIMFVLNLAVEYGMPTYQKYSTEGGLFDGEPDQVVNIIRVNNDPWMLYFTEDGGTYSGVHASDHLGAAYPILRSTWHNDETTGLAFSPDGKHMYVAYQKAGLLYEVTRNDGLAFDAKTLNVKYHTSYDDTGRYR